MSVGPTSISFITNGDVTIVELPQEVMDPLELVEMGDRWIEFVEKNSPKKMVVDFSHVLKFSSQAVGILIRVSRRINENGGDIKLGGMSDRIKELFKICNLIPHPFTHFDSISEAVDSFGLD